jgi:hypothetical protein
MHTTIPAPDNRFNDTSEGNGENFWGHNGSPWIRWGRNNLYETGEEWQADIAEEIAVRGVIMLAEKTREMCKDLYKVTIW